MFGTNEPVWRQYLREQIIKDMQPFYKLFKTGPIINPDKTIQKIKEPIHENDIRTSNGKH